MSMSDVSQGPKNHERSPLCTKHPRHRDLTPNSDLLKTCKDTRSTSSQGILVTIVLLIKWVQIFFWLSKRVIPSGGSMYIYIYIYTRECVYARICTPGYTQMYKLLYAEAQSPYKAWLCLSVSLSLPLSLCPSLSLSLLSPSPSTLPLTLQRRAPPAAFEREPAAPRRRI